MKLDNGKRLLTLVQFIIIAFTDVSNCRCEQSLIPPADECVCPGNSLQLTCTAVGIGTTVWTVGQECSIGLQHLQFATGVTRSCSTVGAPSGSSLSVEGDCYMSQLTIMVTPDLNGTNVGCEHDNGTGAECIGNYLIILTSKLFPPPDDVRLTNITSEGLTFSWSGVTPNCSAIFYNISATAGCGECPANTTLTNATCSGVHLTEDLLCDFSVQTSVCNKVAGNPSDPLSIMLPSAPKVKIFPKYQQTTTSLISFMTVIDKIAPISISGINITIQFFTIRYLINGSVCDSEKIELSDQACVGDVCTTEYDAISDCIINTTSDITVSVTATSDRLGTGQEFQSSVDGTYVNFVNVSHGTNSIICTFVYQQGNSMKSCNATYGQCGLLQSQFAQSVGSGTQMVLNLELSDSVNYCYTVVASNDTVTVLIEGSITRTQSNRNTGPLIGSLAAVALVLAAIVITLTLVSWYIYRKKKGTKGSIEFSQIGGQELRSTATNPQEEYHDKQKSEENDSQMIPQHDQVSMDTHLATDNALKVSYDEETSEEKQSQSHQECKNIQPTADDPQEDHHDGPNSEENIIQHRSRDQLDQESPDVPMTQDTISSKNQIDDSQISTTLESIDKINYNKHIIDKDSGLEEFFDERGIEFCRGCAFYEFQRKVEDIHKNSIIILVDKHTDEYYSGDAARKMVGIQPTSEEVETDSEITVKRPDHLHDKYMVFVQDRGPGSRFLPKGSRLLIQQESLEKVSPGRFLQLEVKEGCELRTFIESQTHPYQDKKLSFYRGNAFYEFSHKSEDITGKKEVVLMDVKTKTLYTGERAKLMLGVPGKGIQNPYADKKRWRVFVQSTCTGNRHLDKGTVVLYESDIKLRKSNPSTASIFMEEVEDNYEKIDVTKDCSLRNFIEDIKKFENPYERGCSYYELTDKEVDIDSGKEVMLMNKAGKLFAGQAAGKRVGAPGINLKNPNLPEYSRVFIRCNGPGYNIHIGKGTSVLYKDPKIPPNLTPVNLEEFYRFEVLQTCELRRFVEQELQKLGIITYKKGNAYFQFTCATEDIEKNKEVLLMDKEGKLFTGPTARLMIGAPGIGIPKPQPDFEYTVFIQNRSRGSRCLIKGSVLYYKR